VITAENKSVEPIRRRNHSRGRSYDSEGGRLSKQRNRIGKNPSQDSRTVEPSDAELMSRLGTGDMECLGQLYVRRRSMVRYVLKQICPEMSDAEADEMVHDVFLLVHRMSRKYVEQGRFNQWLWGIAARTAKSWRRAHWNHMDILDRNWNTPVGIAARGPMRPDEDVEIRDELRCSLNLLSFERQEVLFLSAVVGLKAEEIADTLGICPETVWTRLHRARLQLKEARATEASTSETYRKSA
jgi:RNA polymerase sigma-70 factor (ECF subfamily)